MVKRPDPCAQGRGTFLRNHAPNIAAMDLFVVPTIGFNLLYVLVIVRLARRELVCINVTAHPTAEWIAQQITEAFPWRLTICQALAFLQGRISQGWGKSKCPCNCVVEIALKHSSPHSPKPHTKRQRPQSILHFLDVLASAIRKLDPDVLMVQSTQVGLCRNRTDCLNNARQWRILVQR